MSLKSAFSIVLSIPLLILSQEDALQLALGDTTLKILQEDV